LLSEAAYGFRYILQRKSLLGLQLVFLFGNFFATLAFTVVAPMILARTQSNELIFGSVQTAGAIGGVVGGLVMSAWGGTKRKVHGVLAGWMISSLSGSLLLGLGRALPLWAAGNFFAGFFMPMINSSNQAIWQAKVAPDIQGRVFAIRRLIAWSVTPIATLIAGVAADRVMEPAMQSGGWLALAFGWLTGIGPGTGMSLLVIFASLGAALVGLLGYFFPLIRNAEKILPDHIVAEDRSLEEKPAETSAVTD
jgi:MFS family permease